MRTYLVYVMAGFFATFLYNYYANVLRSVGNSVIPLVFLAVSVVLNIGLDLLFVIPLLRGHCRGCGSDGYFTVYIRDRNWLVFYQNVSGIPATEKRCPMGWERI